ncbi:hypothetical protein SRHO_G00176560, partial [Serrasalmus rhombeus]
MEELTGTPSLYPIYSYSSEDLRRLRSFRRLDAPTYNLCCSISISRRPRYIHRGRKCQTYLTPQALCINHPEVWITDRCFRRRPGRAHRGVNRRFLLEVPHSTSSHQSAPSISAHRLCNLALLNCRSLTDKAALVNDLIDQHQLDLFFLTETWQVPGDFSYLNAASPPNFNYLASPRKTGSTACTVGYITAGMIANNTFYLGYNATKFDSCLNNTVLINNLTSITSTVMDPSLQRVILNKLNQLYPSGLPDSVLSQLGPTSLVANVTEINTWIISNRNTLFLLMVSSKGAWTFEQSKAVIRRYLSVTHQGPVNNDVYGFGSILCSFDISPTYLTLNEYYYTCSGDQTTAPCSIGGTGYLSSCSVDQKSFLYSKAKSELSTVLTDPATYYQLISSYLGGAPLEDIQVISTGNINMSIDIFMSLNPAVVMNLSVSTVRDLLGVNVRGLKQYDNSSMIHAWVAKQKQSDLNTLNIGLLGGIANFTDSTLIPTTTPVNITTPKSLSATASTSTFTSSNNSNVNAQTTTSATVTASDNTTVTKLDTVTANNGSFDTTASSIITLGNRTVNTITSVATTAIINTTSSKVAALSSDDLFTLLTCKLPSNVVYSKDVWVLFLQEFAAPLPAALDKYSSVTPSITLPDPSFLNAIGDVIVSSFSAAQLRDAVFITQWFQIRLRPFLSSVPANFLSILSSRTFSCETYQVVVQAFSSQERAMQDQQKLSVISNFIKPFLKGQSCVLPGSNDSDWLVKNFGQFRSSASFSDFISLKSDFNGVNAAEVLTSSQLAELCSDPTRLAGPQDVNSVMAAVSLNQFTSFFDNLTSSIQRDASLYSTAVKEAFLQAALVRGGLSSAAVPDSEVLQWVTVRLRPLLSSLSSADVTPYFSIIRGRSCNTRQTAVSSLDSVRSSFNSDTQTQIYSNIQQLLTGTNGLGCYSGGSFYAFLKNSFLSFGFPDLSTFLSLIPASRQQELLGSISPAELSVFLNGPNTVRNGSDLCTLLYNYNSTNQYLQTQPVVSAAVGRQTLGCVWSRALSASSQDEVDQWFNVRLAQYLPLLSSQLISPTQFSGASCLSYRKLVSVLGNSYNYSATDFTPAVVYSSMKAYLNSSDGSPRCYNSSSPLLNSTAWFANNIGFFITFISLTDLQSFVSDSQIGVFLENSQNIQLFNNSGISSDVTTYYGTQLYMKNPKYNPLSLPGVLLCGAPGSAFVSLTTADSQTILDSLKKSCQQITPEATAALVANFPTLSSDTIKSLGNQSIGLTEGQISNAKPNIINNTLPVLSVITGWNQGQVNNIIQSITNAGFSINSGSSLVTLGTLIGGVPSAAISKIPSTELLTVSQNPTFITNILTAPVILQETYVQKIVSVDQTKVVENVPDALAGFIPPVLLSSPTSVNVTIINKKSWRPEQAVVLFSSVASASDNTEELSESILQGFTCSAVQNLPRSKVTQLVRACRPRAGRNKVVLKEPQLTCMYNYVKDDSNLTFTDFPADMLLYYSLQTLPKVNCGSYFRALGGADFSVLSSVLNRQSALFTNAKDCLGISGVSLNRTQVEVLGNMACTLDPTYIQNSDPLILEKLKNCGDLSVSQVTAIQTLLFSGNTSYGNPSTWTKQTLDQLGILPLYLDQSFWGKFSSTTTTTFQRSFIPSLRKQKVQNWKLGRLFTAANSFTAKSINTKARALTRAACTTGNITEATVADPSFPLGYDSTQFDACLDNTFLKDNIAAITEKVIDSSFLTSILSKLNQLFPSGLSDGVVQILNAVSRVATVSDISKWNITRIDTLSSLMNSDNGDWTSDQSKAIIMKYLSVAVNTLGTAEINAIGSNLCSLDSTVLKSITAQSL